MITAMSSIRMYIVYINRKKKKSSDNMRTYNSSIITELINLINAKNAIKLIQYVNSHTKLTVVLK